MAIHSLWGSDGYPEKCVKCGYTTARPSPHLGYCERCVVALRSLLNNRKFKPVSRPRRELTPTDNAVIALMRAAGEKSRALAAANPKREAPCHGCGVTWNRPENKKSGRVCARCKALGREVYRHWIEARRQEAEAAEAAEIERRLKAS